MMPAAEGALSILSPVYEAAVRARGRLYDAGWLRITRLPVPVIGVGNLTVGGSGKTPMVELVARILSSRGRSPAVVSRGYGGSHSGPATVVSEGAGPVVDSRVGGDEPVMLALALPRGVPVIVSRRRAAGGRLAVERFGARCIVLDDGFQHRALARDLDLLLLDGESPFGNGRLLPAGPLREPLAAMGRAGAIVITRCDAASPDGLAGIAAAAARFCPRAPLLHARTRAAGLVDPRGGGAEPLSRLAGARAVCFAGIARPRRFFDDVERAGARVVEAIPFPDHHRFGPADLARVAAAAARGSADLVLTTLKDAARLRGRPEASSLPSLRALSIETRVDEEDVLLDLLERTSA